MHGFLSVRESLGLVTATQQGNVTGGENAVHGCGWFGSVTGVYMSVLAVNLI